LENACFLVFCKDQHLAILKGHGNNMEQNDNIIEKSILCGLCTGRKDEFSNDDTMNELYKLAQTAGAEVFATVMQNKSGPENATFFGSGKLKEIADICKGNEITLLIFDDELSGNQIKNIEDITEVRVVDRTALILDIFAKRAKSREGKLQVELAQLKYFNSRLIGMRSELSRLGGGIGTRGPGESKLEMDRRHVRKRILSLGQSIEEIAQHRAMLRSRRAKDGLLTVAIVGYTNAGKSTLLNALTGAGVLAEDMLFATLDPTSRGILLPDGREVLLIDTVGFIRKLPHHLIEAFHSTLEEAALSDLILNVCDISDSEATIQLEVADSILKDLGCAEKPQLVVLNKCDQSNVSLLGLRDREYINISAKTGDGLKELLAKISDMLPKIRAQISLLLPYSKGGLVDVVRNYGIITTTDYTADGIELCGSIDTDKLYLVEQYKKSL
jgi:GTP-binding protein HflX